MDAWMIDRTCIWSGASGYAEISLCMSDSPDSLEGVADSQGPADRDCTEMSVTRCKSFLARRPCSSKQPRVRIELGQEVPPDLRQAGIPRALHESIGCTMLFGLASVAFAYRHLSSRSRLRVSFESFGLLLVPR